MTAAARLARLSGSVRSTLVVSVSDDIRRRVPKHPANGTMFTPVNRIEAVQAMGVYHMEAVILTDSTTSSLEREWLASRR